MPRRFSLLSKLCASAAILWLLCTPSYAQSTDREQGQPVRIAPPSPVYIAEQRAPHMSSIGASDTLEVIENWTYSEPERIFSLLSSSTLPNTPSPTLRLALITLLSSPADISLWSSQQQDKWQDLRMEMLFQLEAYDALSSLMSATPLSLHNDLWQQRHHNLAFYTYDESVICDDLEILPTLDAASDRLWPLYCHAIAQDYGKAMLASQLLQEQGITNPAWLEALIARLASDDNTDSTTQPNWPNKPLSAALLFMMHNAQHLQPETLPTQWPLAANTVKERPLWVMQHPALPAFWKLAALRAAIDAGHKADNTWLTALSESLKDDDVQQKLLASDHSPFRLGFIKHYQHIKKQYAVKDIAQSYQAMFTDMPASQHKILATIFADELRELSHAIFRKQALATYAPMFARAFWLSGHWQEAAPWLAVIEKSTNPSLQLLEEFTVLLKNIEHALQNDAPKEKLALIHYSNSEKEGSDVKAKGLKLRLAHILKAFSIESTHPTEAALIKPDTDNSDDYWHKELVLAGENKQTAELILLASHLLSEQKTSAHHKQWQYIIAAFLAAEDYDMVWQLTQEAIADALLHEAQ